MGRAISAATITDTKEEIIAVTLALRGDFDAEIKRLNTARASLDAANAYIGTVDEAAKIKADADEYATANREAADAATLKASGISAAADAKMSTVTAREQAVGAREATCSAIEAKLKAREQAIADAQVTKDAELRERQDGIVKMETDIQARGKQLAIDRAEFNRRLEALRA